MDTPSMRQNIQLISPVRELKNPGAPVRALPIKLLETRIISGDSDHGSLTILETVRFTFLKIKSHWIVRIFRNPGHIIPAE
jgi:hypothetical protein